MVEEIVKIISNESDLTEEEVVEKIENKEKEFKGLVSGEGAAHLVAKELGVDIVEDVDKELKIESIVPGMSKTNVKAKIIDITDTHTFERSGEDEEEGKVRNLVLGDSTGTLRMSLWDEQTEVAEKLDKGDVIEITNAYTREDNRGNAELRIGNNTKIKRIDEEIEAVKSSSGRGSYKKVSINEIQNENNYVEVSGQVVQIYTKNPFYRRCPDCDSTLRKDDEYKCKEHGDVNPVYKIALPIILDDGVGNIRCIVFNETAKKVLGAENIEFNGDVDKISMYAEESIGKRVKVKGRTQFNDFFNTNEIVVNDIELPETVSLIKEKLEEIKSG